jgi:hypothetical protein
MPRPPASPQCFGRYHPRAACPRTTFSAMPSARARPPSTASSWPRQAVGQSRCALVSPSGQAIVRPHDLPIWHHPTWPLASPRVPCAPRTMGAHRGVHHARALFTAPTAQLSLRCARLLKALLPCASFPPCRHRLLSSVRLPPRCFVLPLPPWTACLTACSFSCASPRPLPHRGAAL